MRIPLPAYVPWAAIAAVGAGTVLSFAILSEHFPKQMSARVNAAALAREVFVIDIGIARQMLPSNGTTARECTTSSADATVAAVLEVTMHKLIGVLTIIPLLVFARSVDAQAIDLASLPSIDPICATTDIRPFLAPGVPVKLVRAALRRAWVMDPRIRDFHGLQKNNWDFNDPRAIPGFGPLEPGGDTKNFLAPVFDEERRNRLRTER